MIDEIEKKSAMNALCAKYVKNTKFPISGSRYLK